MRNVLMALLFQLGWFACVTSGARGQPVFALVAAAAVIAGNLRLQRRRWATEARLLAQVTLIGVGIESLHLWAGVCTLIGEPHYPWLCPAWLAALWTMFATLLRGPLVWLKGRYALSALLGATFAAPNYIAGARLGAVALSSNTLFSVAALMASWSLAMPIMVWLAATPAPARETR